ncbi:hypothetical protein TPHA_0C00360 [Tetrapisispora phaffii CBS 4417]|uniref:UNC-45/Cro1/She4 central domain-containing protein n=1 Tax=Tetrapisispora phaffii (strain ATCC 24235 / CBS 4417 / NBRC 1672 / NRRL Y-8282 / UCD 70-5) TaxID=1071381 RepID=G8BR17_TETPH|nr:hypothetical protein TPHA_0C00360 [Tetrapisispora phaffii CBS 4417]CCE62193.1 hypothetical protein TPHA_0C00360 [Tetrapisispora phaffii CBS 4417]
MDTAYSITTISELSELLEKDLKISINTDRFTQALDELFCFSNTGSEHLIDGTSNEKIETILTCSYQDHSESREYLNSLIVKDCSKAIDIFERLSINTVHILVGSFVDANTTLPLVQELHSRIHLGEDANVTYLLSIILQLVIKFDYKFSQICFLIKELGMRIKEREVRSISLVIFSQLENKYKEEFNKSFLKFIDALVIEVEADIGNDPLIIIITLLNELYPVLTTLCSELFLSEALKDLCQERVNERRDPEFSKALLQLLSTACIDENVRKMIAETYIEVLENTLNIPEYSILAALVLIKIWSFTKLHNTTIKSLNEILMKHIENDIIEEDDVNTTEGDGLSNDDISNCLEGLAYLSLKTSVKVRLRANSKFCSALVKIIEFKKVNSKFYGVLVVLANLGISPKDINNGGPDAKSLRDLKSYSDLKNPKTDDDTKVIETVEEVSSFNKKYIIDTGVLAAIRSTEKELSMGSKEQYIRIIYNISREKKFIPDLVKHGCMTSVLEYLINDVGKKNESVRLLTLRSLTRMLIYSNPATIFNKYSSINALPFLFELLPMDQTPEEAASSLFDRNLITNADSFESLLALTNLASAPGSEGEDICKRITGTIAYWTVLENLMLDDSAQLQRCTLELLSNLMSHPLSIAVKFFNFENSQSVKNFNILVKLLELEDIESQRAVAAFFANAANSIPFIAQELLTQKEFIDTTIDVFHNQIDDKELRERFIILYYSLFAVVPEKDTKKLDIITKNKKFEETLKLIQKLNSVDEEYMEVVPLLLSKC